MALAVFLAETPSDYVLLTVLQYLLFVCCVALFPATLMASPPYSATLRRLLHPMFELVLFFVISVSAFSRVSCVVLGPPAGHRNVGVVFLFFVFVFVALCSCPLLFFFLAFRLVLSWRSSVGPHLDISWHLSYQQTAALSPRNSACALSACLFWFGVVSFLFFSVAFLLTLLFVVFFGCTCRLYCRLS